VPGHKVAGKTGTTKKALPTGGYATSKTMASFIGFAPANNPRFAAIVVLDAKDLRYGGAVAAPVFAEIMQFALNKYGVAPSDPANEQYAKAQQTASGTDHLCTVPHGSDLQRVLTEHEEQRRKEAAKTTEPGSTGEVAQPTAGGETTAGSLPSDSSEQN
jgi:membrane peptidoglycan carboxypeptidase